MKKFDNIFEELNSLYEATQEDLIEGTNNKTLKEVMISLAKNIAPDLISNNLKYNIHHLDYDNTNNEIENISLMPDSAHKSFHKKARDLNLDLAGKNLLFKNEYEPNCIKIGELLLNYIKQNGEEAEAEYNSDFSNPVFLEIERYVRKKLAGLADVGRITENGHGGFRINITNWYDRFNKDESPETYLYIIKNELEKDFGCIGINVSREYISGFKN